MITMSDDFGWKRGDISSLPSYIHYLQMDKKPENMSEEDWEKLKRRWRLRNEQEKHPKTSNDPEADE